MHTDVSLDCQCPTARLNRLIYDRMERFRVCEDDPELTPR